MPLHQGAREAITEQLEKHSRGQKISIIVVGELTPQQHAEINRIRGTRNLPELESPELVYLGRHHYKSRTDDKYPISELVAQIESATAADARVVLNGYMTGLEAIARRLNAFSMLVLDRAILELTARKPRAEIFSVIPKGDGLGPRKQKSPD